MLRNEAGLRHLHECGYDFEAATAGITELQKQEGQIVRVGSGSGSSLGWVSQQSSRLDEAMKRYGKDFQKAKRAINRDTDNAVTVGQLTVHYYAKWKHSKAYNQWINTAPYMYRQLQESVGPVAQSPRGSAGIIAGTQSKSRRQDQRKQRRREKRQKTEKHGQLANRGGTPKDVTTSAAAAAAATAAKGRPWSDAEWKSLQRIVKADEMARASGTSSWEVRARQLGTGRSADACRDRYNKFITRTVEDSSDGSSEDSEGSESESEEVEDEARRFQSIGTSKEDLASIRNTAPEMYQGGSVDPMVQAQLPKYWLAGWLHICRKVSKAAWPTDNEIRTAVGWPSSFEIRPLPTTAELRTWTPEALSEFWQKRFSQWMNINNKQSRLQNACGLYSLSAIGAKFDMSYRLVRFEFAGRAAGLLDLGDLVEPLLSRTRDERWFAARMPTIDVTGDVNVLDDATGALSAAVGLEDLPGIEARQTWTLDSQRAFWTWRVSVYRDFDADALRQLCRGLALFSGGELRERCARVCKLECGGTAALGARDLAAFYELVGKYIEVEFDDESWWLGYVVQQNGTALQIEWSDGSTGWERKLKRQSEYRVVAEPAAEKVVGLVVQQLLTQVEDATKQSKKAAPAAAAAGTTAKQVKRSRGNGKEKAGESNRLERMIQIALTSGGKIPLPAVLYSPELGGAVALSTAGNDEQPQQIAQKLGVSLREVMVLNKKQYAGLRADSNLFIGTVLQVPAKASAGDEAAQSPDSAVGQVAVVHVSPPRRDHSDHRWDRWQLRQVLKNKGKGRDGALTTLGDRMEHVMVDFARENDCEEGYSGVELFKIPRHQGKNRGTSKLSASIQKLSEISADKRYGLPPLMCKEAGGTRMYRYRHGLGATTGEDDSEVEAALLSIVDQLERDAEADELEVEEALLCAIDDLVEVSTDDDDSDAAAGSDAGLLTERLFWTHEKGPTVDELVECLWTMWQLPDKIYGSPRDRMKIRAQVNEHFQRDTNRLVQTVDSAALPAASAPSLNDSDRFYARNLDLLRLYETYNDLGLEDGPSGRFRYSLSPVGALKMEQRSTGENQGKEKRQRKGVETARTGQVAGATTAEKAKVGNPRPRGRPKSGHTWDKEAGAGVPVSISDTSYHCKSCGGLGHYQTTCPLRLGAASAFQCDREWGDGETPELYAESTQLMMGRYRLKIGLMDPPRVVIRDMVAMVCELTNKESAALNIKSLARNLQYEKLSKSKEASSTVVISLENLHELLHICATFRAAAYKPKVLNLLKQGNPTLPRLFAMARVVALSVARKQPFPPPVKGEFRNLVGLPVLAMYNKGTAQESWYFGDVQQQTAQNYTLHFYVDDTT